MRVNFKNEKGICTREEFIKGTPSITIPEVTHDCNKARERLAELKNVDLEKAAMIVAAGWDTKYDKKTSREHVEEVSLDSTGELFWEVEGDHLPDEKPIFAAFRDCLADRIASQQQIVEFLEYDFGEVEE